MSKTGRYWFHQWCWLTVVCGIVFTSNSLAADINKADDLFDNQSYSQALVEYQQAAKSGNPHAFYRLGLIYNNGLAVEKNPLASLLHFDLAAEQNYRDALEIKEKLLANVAEAKREQFMLLLKQNRRLHGVEATQAKYYPKLLAPHALDKLLASHPIKDKKLRNFRGLPPHQAVFNNNIVQAFYDCERAGDGSSRYPISLYQFFPRYKPLPFDVFSTLRGKHKQSNSLPSFSFNCIFTETGGYQKRPAIEKMMTELSAKADGGSADDKYQYAMWLIGQPWRVKKQRLQIVKTNSYDADDNVKKAITLLTEAAQAKHPAAMFYLGSRNYLQVGRDIELGVNYIAEAARYNYAPAEYRLGRLLTEGVVVEPDHHKALFWLNSASEQGLLPAQLKVIDLLLFSEDESIRNVPKAIELLDKIELKNTSHPDYQYLLAFSYKDRADKSWPKFFQHLQKAIVMAQRKNWDTSEWQSQYQQYLNGNITITEEAEI